MDAKTQEEWISYLSKDSGLPGPRANLKKTIEFSEALLKDGISDENFKFIQDLYKTESDGNDEKTVLVLSHF